MSKLDTEVRALFRRYQRDGDALHALLAACGLKFEGTPPPPFDRVGYLRPTTRPLTAAEHAMMAELDAQLLSERPCSVPSAQTPAERWAQTEERQRERVAGWTPAERAAMRRHGLRDTVRYGCRRLRAGNEYRWARPLAVVRTETAAALRTLGHAGLARVVEPPGQMELGL